MERTYAQCKEMHVGNGNSGWCSLQGIGCQILKDINKALLGWGWKLLGPWFIMQSENWLKPQYYKQGHEMQSKFNAKKCPFLYILVYLVWKRGKLVPNRHLFKSNLWVWKRQVHSAIFSIFDSESEKSLTKTHDLSNPVLTSVKGTNHSKIFSVFRWVRKNLNWDSFLGVCGE